MKNTKRYLLAALALVIVAASMFVMVSCGGSHKHEYTSVVTDPTCTERGYTTHTCECGDSYVDTYVDASHDLVEHAAKAPNCAEAGHDAYVTCKNCDYTTYKELPAGDHNYDMSVTKVPSADKKGKAVYTCEGCGNSYEAEITLDDIELPDFMGAVASVIGDGYYSIDLGDGFNLIIIKEKTETNVNTYESEFEGTKSFLAVKLPKAYLDIKNGYLKSELVVEIGTAYIEFGVNEDPSEIDFVEFDSESTYSIAIDGNKISYKAVDGDDVDEYEATVHELIVLLASRYVGQEINYDSIVEIYAVLQQLECFVPVFENIAEKLEGMGNVESEADLSALIEILSAFGSNVIEVTTEGEDTVYTLKLDNLSVYVEYLKEATVADIIDDCFGEGFAETLKAFVISLPDLTVKQIADAAIVVSESYGLNVDEFYALVNGAVYLYTRSDFDIAAEIEERNEYTLAMLVAEMMGAPEENLEAVAENFRNSISSAVEFILSSTVDELFASMGAEEEPDMEGEPVEDEEKPSLTDMLASYVALLGESVEAKVVVDVNGNVKSIEYSLAQMVTGSYEVKDDGSISATFNAAGIAAEYESVDGAYRLQVTFDGEKILEGEFKVADEGYEFDGTLYINGMSANLTATYTLDGTLDALVTYTTEDIVKLSIKYDKENFDILLKHNEYTMFNLYVDIADGIITAVDLDAYNLETNTAPSETIGGVTNDSEPKHELAFSLNYSNNSEGVYQLNIVAYYSDVVFSAIYDGENLDIELGSIEYTMLSLYVDIADGTITAVDFDVYDLESVKKPILSLPGMSDEDIENLPPLFVEIVKEHNHVFGFDYLDNGDGTCSLNAVVTGRELEIAFVLDLVNATLDCEVTVRDETVLEGVIAVLDDKLTVDAKIYDESDVMVIDIDWSAESYKCTVVINEEYKVMDVDMTFADGVITSAYVEINVIDVTDDNADTPEDESKIELENALKIDYTLDGNKATFEIKNDDYAESVITVTVDENGVAADAIVKYFEDVYDENGEVVDKEEVVIFDGGIGVSVSSVGKEHSITLSVDVDKLFFEEYSHRSYNDGGSFYYIEILENIICAFDGEITFSYTEAK